MTLRSTINTPEVAAEVDALGMTVPVVGIIANNFGNDKTGRNCVSVSIGTTREESLLSCVIAKCALLHRKHGGKGGKATTAERKQGITDEPLCYSTSGTSAMAHVSQCKSAAANPDKLAPGGKYTLEWALKHRSVAATMVRMTRIGDAIALTRLQGATIRAQVKAAGLRIVGYTHGWRQKSAAQWKGVLMASCDNLAEADEAVAAGWRAAVVLTRDDIGDEVDKWKSVPDNSRSGIKRVYTGKRRFTTPGGTPVVVCPQQCATVRNCNDDCGGRKGQLCDGSREDLAAVAIGFIDHSPGTATSAARDGSHGKRRRK